MSTKSKKSPDNTHKLNKRAICLRAPLALIILLVIFLAPQRSASTKALPQDPAGRESMQIEMMKGGHKAMAGEVLVRFDADDEVQRQTFVDNVRALVNASDLRGIGPASLGLFHFRSKNMNTQALVNLVSRLPGVRYAEPNYIVETQLTPNDT